MKQVAISDKRFLIAFPIAIMLLASIAFIDYQIVQSRKPNTDINSPTVPASKTDITFSIGDEDVNGTNANKPQNTEPSAVVSSSEQSSGQTTVSTNTTPTASTQTNASTAVDTTRTESPETASPQSTISTTRPVTNTVAAGTTAVASLTTSVPVVGGVTKSLNDVTTQLL